MKIKVFTVYGKDEVFDITNYEHESGVLTLYLTNGSFIQYSPYDWICIEELENLDEGKK